MDTDRVLRTRPASRAAPAQLRSTPITREVCPQPAVTEPTTVTRRGSHRRHSADHDVTGPTNSAEPIGILGDANMCKINDGQQEQLVVELVAVPGQERVELRAGPSDDLRLLRTHLARPRRVDGALLLRWVEQDQPVIDAASSMAPSRTWTLETVLAESGLP